MNKKLKLESYKMNKKLIRLTESDLHQIVKESVNDILSEGGFFGNIRRKMNIAKVGAQDALRGDKLSSKYANATLADRLSKLVNCLVNRVNVMVEMFAKAEDARELVIGSSSLKEQIATIRKNLDAIESLMAKGQDRMYKDKDFDPGKNYL